MADEQVQEMVEQPQAVPGAEQPGSGAGAAVPDVPSTSGPASLDEAFRQLRANDQGAADANVEPQPGVDTAGDTGDSQPDGGPAVATPAVEEQLVADTGGVPDTQPVGGSEQIQAVSTDNLRRQLAQQAANLTIQAFKENRIEKLSIGDLYEQDQNTGRVTFRNPDDPQRPFQSRVEAQQFVEAFNANIDSEMRKFQQGAYQELVSQQADVFAMLDFIPTYNQMPAEVQRTFDALIEPYQQTASDGTITFPGVDFNRAAQQAYNIGKLYSRQAEPAPAEKPSQTPSQASGPALDMHTGSGPKRAADRQPRNLSEAFKLINEQRAEKRKGNRK